MKRLIGTFSLFHFFTFSVYADDCLRYKVNPNVEIKTPLYSRETVSVETESLHGEVIGDFVQNFTLGVEVKQNCLVLTSVQATVGYKNFLIKISDLYEIGSDDYEKTLAHEDQHISAYLSVIKDYSDEIMDSVQTAADSVIPLNASENTLDKFNEQIQNHPQMILLGEKIKAELEIRNKKVDM